MSKRAGGSSSATKKRTRFASPSPAAESSGSAELNDAFLEEDIQQGAARDKQKAKRKVRDAEGYKSDSSGDEEGVVPSRRATAVDDDVDMFAEDVPTTDAGKAKGKDKEFMELKDIEGQEFLGKDESDESEEEEDEKGKRKRGLEKDLGFEVTPFNMKNEMDSGRFTADGETYVENERDEGDKHDVWLDDVDKDAMKKARKAHKERERLEKQRQEKEQNGEHDPERKAREQDLMREAMGLMERGETILEALQRLGKDAEDKRKKEDGGKKKSWIERQRERKAASQHETSDDPLHTSNPFTNLTNIVSELNNIGHLDVYSLSRESLQRMLPAPTTNGSAGGSTSGKPTIDGRQFQYRFSMPYVRSLPEAQRPVEREVFGPFPLSQLQQWRGTGFFGGPAAENVELRTIQAGGEGSSWGSWADIVGS